MTLNSSVDSSVDSSTDSSADIATARPLIETPIATALLQRLFALIGVAIAPGKLQQSWEQIQQEQTMLLPSQRVQLLLKQLQVRGVRVAQLRWARMDPRRLPALMLWQGDWYLAERQMLEADSRGGPDGDAATGDGSGDEPGRFEIALTREDGSATLHSAQELEEGVVLWLANARNGASERVSLTGSHSAQLVREAMFRQRRWVLDISVATLVINLLAVATSLFAMQVYDRVVPTLAWATLWTLVAGMLIVTALDWVLKILRARILDAVACEVDEDVSARVFRHLLHLQLDSRPRSLGTMAAQVSGLESVRGFFSSGIVFALVDMPFALLFILFIAVIGGPIAWVYAALLPVAIALGWIGQRAVRRLTREEIARSNERQGLLVDVIQGTESIRAANATWRFDEQWMAINQAVAGFGIQQKSLNNLIQVSTATLSSLAYLAAVVVGVYGVADGALTMGAMIACSILGGKVIAPVSQAVRFLTQWENVQQSLRMVDEVLALKTERRAEQSLMTPGERPATVDMQGVTFSYPETPVLQLEIPALRLVAGDRIALLGQIGSGKSTLLKILAGLYRPTEGRIRLGKGDLWEMDPAVVAEQIGYLPQSVHLFKGTLKSNLMLGGAVADSHLLAVAEELGIDQIAADSPFSMDLPISEGGEGLSGGQRQLVGVGRLILAQPTVWLLDEPTASLDPETEKKVLAAIQAHVKPADILVVSTHRPAIASQLARRVLVMQRGRIVADDKPEAIFQRPAAARPEPGAAAPRPMAGGPLNVI